MVIDTPFLKLAMFLQTHTELSDFISRLRKIEIALTNDEVRPTFLATLVMSDTIVDIDTANETLERLTFIKDNLHYMVLEENVNKEVTKYLKDTLKAVRKKLKEFKKKEE